MAGFDLLHPALQHQVVNALGWRELRPFQDAVIPRILAGEHLIVLAPTAGGKTEAAVFPLLSRVLSEDWNGLSVLYVCPIKALLNNLDDRLQRYSTLVGRRSALWHGDVKASARRAILRDPPDCLLTTPESLEGMLVSPNVDEKRLFSRLQAVVIDEVHAFAGDDRGWHLLAVLERISRIAGRELQRIGLSATVGNPETLVEWLSGACARPRGAFLPPPGSSSAEADVELDFVGSLANAALVVSRLHRGEKRLVFVDSRSRAEQLGADLRRFDVDAYVTHSSLSQEQRRQAENAFASGQDCVIVATSALELGIDVGDLDRVIQIDAPPTVASFLQRMGRTGRRAGVQRNCLFLATKDDALLQAAGLIRLWSQGYVEPIVPPPRPLHVFAQQIMALALQEGGIGRDGWRRWIGSVPGFSDMPPDWIESTIQHMLDERILWDENGLLSFDVEGERTFGRRNFLELLSVFLSPPLFSVLHGRQEIGYVDQTTFLGKQEGPRVLTLAGRAWRVNHIDWGRRVAYVEPSDATGRSRWRGQGLALGFRLSQAIKTVLTSDDADARWSRRALERVEGLREEFAWLPEDSTAALPESDGSVRWWTFGGSRANSAAASWLSEETESKVGFDSFSLNFESSVKVERIEAAVDALRSIEPAELHPSVEEAAADGLKFSQCIPLDLAVAMLEQRLLDESSVRSILAEPTRYIASP